MIQQNKLSLREQFQLLADKWREEVQWTSSINDMVMNDYYQQIIGLGPDAIPILLEEMQLRPDQWSWALHAITRDNPVEKEHRGNIELMAQDWVEWGKLNGYIS